MNLLRADCALAGTTIAPLFTHSDFPMLIRPSPEMSDPITWARGQREAVDQLMLMYGALLFRGFAPQNAAHFEALVDALCPNDWVEYREASTPRSHVGGHVFTSTEYYPELRIYVHNENSHVTSWPLYVFFHCRTPAAEGGRTPIADCRRVYDRLPAELLAQFEKTGWMYRRNFYPGSSITWQKAFGTDSRAELDSYCHENHMTARWRDDTLTIRYRRWAALRHPRTNDLVWFNHGTFFNPHTLEPTLKKAVLASGDDRLPYNTYYGDGSPIEEHTIKTLDAAYAAETVSFDWQVGDVLMLDNMRIAHGRTAYKGQREVLVAMKHKVRCSDVASYEQYSVPV